MKTRPAVLIPIVLAIFVLIFFLRTDLAPNLNSMAAVIKSALIDLTNRSRAENQSPALKTSVLLEEAAVLKAQDMAAKGYFAHVSPDGQTPWFWLDKVGYEYSYAGENLAMNFFDSADVAKAWMNSPAHRQNIVNKNYREMGIGLAQGIYQGKDTVFVAQFFGTPARMTIQSGGPAAAAVTKPAQTTIQSGGRTKKILFRLFRGEVRVPADGLYASVIKAQ